MDWIRVNTSISIHPKTKRAAKVLGVHRLQMVGHLVSLWSWCMQFAPDGDLCKFNPDEIADGACWEGDPKKFVDTLVNCGPGESVGFLEDDGIGLKVHDWSDYSEKVVSQSTKSTERSRKWREKKKAEKEEAERVANALQTDSTRVAGRVGDAPRTYERNERDVTYERTDTRAHACAGEGIAAFSDQELEKEAALLFGLDKEPPTDQTPEPTPPPGPPNGSNGEAKPEPSVPCYDRSTWSCTANVPDAVWRDMDAINDGRPIPKQLDILVNAYITRYPPDNPKGKVRWAATARDTFEKYLSKGRDPTRLLAEIVFHDEDERRTPWELVETVESLRGLESTNALDLFNMLDFDRRIGIKEYDIHGEVRRSAT